ncbi:MAG: amidohydrolase [Peptoniphilaceae bacterium]|nr:amidohydrolase [Peptoniphilaceae bacterium]MDD7383368.1 amidohydrolase [Peptoniphilaceae bacterium]MDY3738261.1 amidohydrolase [Peptoniphilaceae bacterium]
MKLEVRNTEILSMEDENIKKGNIYIENDKIVDIGYLDNFVADKIINGEDKVSMPGLINCHNHVGMTLFRNYADDMTLDKWLNEKIWPLEDKLIAEDVYWASMLSIAEMISNGTTTFADMYYFEEEVVKAIEKTKIRAQLSRGLTNFEGEGYEKLEENIDYFKKYNNYLDGLITIGFGPHAVYTTDEEFLKEISKVAKKYNAPIHIHLSETLKENKDSISKFGKTPTEIFNDANLLGEKTIAAHGIYLSDNDLKILKETNTSLVHCPISNLKLSSGFMDTKKVHNCGINLCLGTDSAASNNRQSILREMNVTSLVSRMNDENALNSYEIIKMATINGAKALGMDKEIGSLKKGKKADIILVDKKSINHTPNSNFFSNLVYSTSQNDILDVIINGEVVYENKKFLNFDIEEIKYNANKSFEKLKER